MRKRLRRKLMVGEFDLENAAERMAAVSEHSAEMVEGSRAMGEAMLVVSESFSRSLLLNLHVPSDSADRP